MKTKLNDDKKNKLRILMLNYEFPPLGGGASPVSYEIAKGYAKLGHKVDVVTMHMKGLKQEEIKDKIHIYRVKCIRKKKEICHPWEQYTYIRAAKKFLKNHLKNHEYDINHTHFIIPTGVISLWLKKNYNLPYIITSHGSDVPGFNTDRFKFLHKFTGPMLRNICKEAKLITTPSKYLADLIKKQIGNYSTKVIPNGSRDFYIKGIEKQNIIMSSGRLLERKGFQYLIRAFNGINPKNWKLYIVGDGPYREELLRLANKNKNIIFTGWLDNSKKEYSEILNKSKIFVLLSERESQGIVYIEAMSTGCAILSSNITACKETVSKNVGILVNPKDSKILKENLSLLIRDNSKLNRFMINSRKRYDKYFQYKNIIKNYDGVLR